MPMMCGWMLKASKPREQKRLRGFGRMLVALQQGYGKSLKWVLNHTRLVGVVLLGTIALNIWLYISIPKTFFPEQDTGVLMGGIQADQSISFILCCLAGSATRRQPNWRNINAGCRS